jgi:tetratricopeptide (TPR) repeat protein
MKIELIKKSVFILIVSAIIGTNLKAQERNDVIKAYNEGAKAMQTDVQAAIVAFETVVTLSEKVGDSASDLKQKATQVLPGLYVKAATNAINEKKTGTEIIKAAKSASLASDKYGSKTAKENAGKILVQGYYIMGTDFFNKQDYNNAIASFDSLLSLNPGYTAAIYNKALVYRTQNNASAFEENIDLFIEKLKATNDTVKIKQASKMALEYFRASGSKSNQANKPEEALVLLKKAAKYGDDKDLFYYFSDVFNKQKNYVSGAEFASKGLNLETGTPEAKAKYYFQLGMAQAGQGKTAEACESFKNSMFGAFAEASKAQRTNLKCK